MSGKAKKPGDSGKMRPSDWNRLTKRLVTLTAGTAAATDKLKK